MSTNLADVIRSITPGIGAAAEEAKKNKKFFLKVFVDSKNRERLLSSNQILLVVGGKGSGKTRLFLHLKNVPQQGEKPIQKICACLDAAGADYAAPLDAFKHFASVVNGHSQKHGIPVCQAYKAFNGMLIERNWLHLLAHEALKAVKCSLNDHCVELITEELRTKLAGHMRDYGIIESDRVADKVDKLLAKYITRKKMKINFKVSSASVQFDESECDPREVFRDIQAAMEHLKWDLYVIVDTADEILDSDEEMRLCLLAELLQLAERWHFDRISLKLFMRADCVKRANYRNKDRLFDRYIVLKWEKEHFLRLVLKRLLYSEKVCSAVKFSEDLNRLDSKPCTALEELFAWFFGDTMWDIPSVALPEKDVFGHTDHLRVPSHEFLYRFFTDAKGSVAIRQVIIFLNQCKNLELRRREEDGNIEAQVSSESPLFHLSTIQNAIFEFLPNTVLEQIENEYTFIGKDINKLRSLCGKRFDKQEILAVLSEAKDPTTDLVELVFEPLFYSGLIGGNAPTADNCSKFYFPMFVHYALAYGKSETHFTDTHT